MKKTFSCGHKGQGRWCHRCALADAILTKLEGKPVETEWFSRHTLERTWERFNDDPDQLRAEAERLKA